MARRDFYDDPSAPPINSVVPAVTAFVLNADGAVLMERRSDNGLWGLPGASTNPARPSVILPSGKYRKKQELQSGLPD